MERLKETFAHYGMWSAFLGVIAIIIKPFISVKQTVRDMIITFIVSMLSGLLTEYMDIPLPVKYGISGVCGLFGVRLYAIADGILKTAEKNPVDFIKTIKGKKPHQ
jgi:hypothetical protein